MNRAEYEAILNNAIQSEIEAQQFYQEAADRMTNPFLKNLFSEFATEEKKHEAILKGFRSTIPETLPFTENRDYKVSQSVDRPLVSADMTPAQAFALAIKNEEAAMHHYMALADGCIDPTQKQIFIDLAAMERDHKFKMERAFMDVGYPEVW